MKGWKFGATVAKARAEALLEPWSWPALRERIVTDAQYLCCHYEVCEVNPAFGRIAYCVRVSPETFDLFFNSPYGYRGAYFRSPYEGLHANAELIDALSPGLIGDHVSRRPYRATQTREPRRTIHH